MRDVMTTTPGAEITLDRFQVEQITGGELDAATDRIAFQGAAYDSRRVARGNLFVALRGQRTDGHRHLDEATARGAAVLLLEAGHPDVHPAGPEPPRIRVPDTLRALQALASWHRDRFDLPLVAVTGSNGKTTTKEMIAAVLSARYRVFKTPGNLNSGIGVPVALFDLTAEHQVGVCELGMSQAGEIDRLGRIVRPRYAVFTNIAPAHLEFLGSLEAVAAAKFELLPHVAPDGLALFCADDPVLARRAAELGPRSRTFGQSEAADLRAYDLRTDARGVRFRLEGGEDVFLPLFGRHNVCNALAALQVARLLGVDTLAAVAALAVMAPAPHRSRIRPVGPLVVIDDSYNANPQAAKAALQALAEYPGAGRRVAVLGDMLELGTDTIAWHREVGALASEVSVDFLVTVGTLAQQIARAARAAGMTADTMLHFEDAATCAESVSTWCRTGDVILLKGSRGIALETVLDALERQFATIHKEES